MASHYPYLLNPRIYPDDSRRPVRAPTWSEGLVPPVGMGDSIARTANGITDPYEFENEPEGLLVGYTHGAARWVPWHRLRAVRNHNWLFYDPKE